MRATELNWSSKIHERLSRDEWPGDVLDHMTETVILALSDLRNAVSPDLLDYDNELAEL